MVVKNEAVGLKKAVASCENFVNEIVIAVDSKSDDGTLDIAQQLTKNVKIFEWCDDFSFARNFACEGVKSDWILFLDGHEFVKSHERLWEALNLDVDGLLCTLELDHGSRFLVPRIYKNGIKFVGRIHEKPDCKSVVPFEPFIIKHDVFKGQDPKSTASRTEQKKYQMTEIMKSESDNDKKNVRASFHVAMYFHSIQNYKQAIKYQKRCLKYSTNTEERWFLYFHLALCRMSLGHYFRAFWAVSRAESELAGRWETLKLKGMIYFTAKKFRKSATTLLQTFFDNTERHNFNPWPIDPGATWNVAGECFFQLYEYEKASICFERASDLEKNLEKKKFFKDRSKLMANMFKSSNE